MFFEYYFSDYDLSKKESAVCCPFPHHTVEGLEYYESRPSAHVNTDSRVFNCKSCGEGKNEIGFIAAVLGCTYENAMKINKYFNNYDDLASWDENIITNQIKDKCISLGISDEVINDLKIKTEDTHTIAFPVMMFNKLVDVRTYNPGGTPKIKSRPGATSGFIIPYDLWQLSPKSKWTILCAGEKDMAVARSNGLEAITLTGGEMALPLFTNCFKGRKIAICYDNDEAGLKGAQRVASVIKEYAEEVKVVTGFHEVCIEKGEDITDFFMKYNKTKADLIEYIKAAPEFTEEDMHKAKESIYPTITLLEASKPQYINKIVRSNIQVLSTYESAFVVPTSVIARKTCITGKNDTMELGEEREWYLAEHNAQDILKLIDGTLTEKDINLNLRQLMGIPEKESYITMSKPTKETVFKCTVSDLFESSTDNTVTIEYGAYILRHKLESGKKYKVTYKLCPHPNKGQHLIMVILDLEQASDSVTNFKVSDQVKTNLQVVQNIAPTVEEKMNILTQKVKGLLGYNGNDQLIQAFDLAYHTVLSFNFGNFKNVRGYLDTIIVGESRIGKSSTAEALRNTYELGVFTSLAGNSATIPGLVGGSNKVNGSFQTRAGLIPQNHRGLIIFEEFAKAQKDISAELTDIRSSNEVRITRVSGSLTLPALVRMVTLTNVKADPHGGIRPIAAYPNGIEILTELVGTAEDIARYDIALILSYSAEGVDPFWQPEEPLDKEVYKTRVRWVWSRTPEQVKIGDDVFRYICDKCKELNSKYESHIKIFGTECWKKLTRLAIAVAGYTVSTDDTYENIVVTKECVDYAVNYLVNIYDNSTFKLKQYVEAERMYSTIDDEGIALLQDMYITVPGLLLQLEQNSKVSQQALIQMCGLERDTFNKQTAKLVRGMFIKYASGDILPTQRFRLGMSRINRNVAMKGVGELV